MNAGGFGTCGALRFGGAEPAGSDPFPQLYGADPELRVLAALEDVSAGTVEGEQYSVAHAPLEGTEQQALDALNYYIEAYCSCRQRHYGRGGRGLPPEPGAC